jgi:hypothetical protein
VKCETTCVIKILAKMSYSVTDKLKLKLIRYNNTVKSLIPDMNLLVGM